MKFDFNISFQKILLAALLKDPELAFTYRYIIQPEYFETEILVMICGALFNYLDKYKKLPRKKFLADKLRREIQQYVKDPSIEEATIETLRELYQIKLQDIAYLLDCAASFAEGQTWKEVFLEAPDYIDAQDYASLFDKCIQARDKGRVFLPYILEDQLDKRFERTLSVVESGLIKTGIKHLDERYKIYPPFFGLITGYAGKGKTWFLLHLAKSALRQGYNVLFFTGEMSPDDLAIRFDASLLKVNTDYFYDLDVFEKLRNNLKEAYKKLTGKLTILQFNAGLYSVGEFEADVRRFCLNEETKPSLILLDFVDLLTFHDSSKRGLSGWEEQKKVCLTIEGIAQANATVIWAAGTLLTKGQEAVEGKLATRQSKSGAGDIIYALDGHITLNQSVSDMEQSRILLYIDKWRKARDQWVIGVLSDFSRSTFCVKSLGAISKSMLDAKKEKKKGN